MFILPSKINELILPNNPSLILNQIPTVFLIHIEFSQSLGLVKVYIDEKNCRYL